MKIIVISNPSSVEGEHEMIHQLFDAGLQYFHVRKPSYSIEKLKRYLEKIDKKFRDRIILHNHHNLCIQLKLRGIHLTKRHRNKNRLGTWLMTIYLKFRKPDIQISTSFHVIKSLSEYKAEYAYVLLSPIFDSISKLGYKNTFNDHSLKEALSKTKFEVIALGGVNYDVLEKIKEYGFSGFALLGGIWGKADPVAEFKKIKDKWNQIENSR